MQTRRVLVFRLSSLGDLVLSTAALSSGVFEGPVDWVVSSELAPLLRGHPGIRKVWEFDKNAKLRGWIELCRQLKAEGYDFVFDLHGSLRTLLARLYFGVGSSSAQWRKISKSRWRLYGLYTFKRYWPDRWKPQPFVGRFAKLAGGTGVEKPDLTHLLSVRQEALLGTEGGHSVSVRDLDSDLEFGFWLSQKVRGVAGRTYYSVMPSSKWDGKCWPAQKYLEVAKSVLSEGLVPVVLGSSTDRGSAELSKLLAREGIEHFSGVGRWSLRQVAQVLAGSSAYLGNDTGLAHLAESLGVRAFVVFGPTSPFMGFGPWRKESRAIELENLGCRPCGKDGRRCYRLTQKYLCMTGLDSSTAVRELSALVFLSPSSLSSSSLSSPSRPASSSGDKACGEKGDDS